MELCRFRLIDKYPARAHDPPEPPFCTVPGDIKAVLPHKGSSSAQHNYGFPGLANLVDNAERFLSGEHSVYLTNTCVHVTVGTFQWAPERDVPRDNTWAVYSTFQSFNPFATRLPGSLSTVVRFSTIEDFVLRSGEIEAIKVHHFVPG